MHHLTRCMVQATAITALMAITMLPDHTHIAATMAVITGIVDIAAKLSS